MQSESTPRQEALWENPWLMAAFFCLALAAILSFQDWQVRDAAGGCQTTAQQVVVGSPLGCSPLELAP